MKQKYYVNDNQQVNGDHEVHTEACRYLPGRDRTYLGEFESCFPAVREAKKHYNQTNGCIHCCEPCHTS
jgi:hypothetical protein